MENSNDHYDSPWKSAIERYFPEFMEFYFPAAHAEIDWSKDHVFLDQELQAVVQDAELGKRFVDTNNGNQPLMVIPYWGAVILSNSRLPS